MTPLIVAPSILAAAAGANAIVAGSVIFGSDDYAAAIARIRSRARSSKEAVP
jgi:pentose-5-phosphate-3-epimerase